MFLTVFTKRIAAAIVILFLSSFAFAGQAVEKPVLDKITAKMDALKIQVLSVTPFAVDGLYELVTDKGIFYISKNTQFLIDGNVYDLDNKMTNLSEQSLAALRKNKLKAFAKDMIVYKAAQEKHVITVFTDTTCGYCRKLHSQMADYNKLGITVRYLAFPRSGLNSSTYHSMASIWCADDPKLAMDDAQKGREIAFKTCKNTVKEQYELGLSFGVNGTPAIVLEDGSLKPGYVPAERLIKMLDKK
ncbi:MAG: bifunctional protein-disulfide isomerase/oxidoreductase DsbC [Psychromonas sp.]|nr:bifunctional protein-disulfide isomerase/oxidoreductase DsbC [Psychromonas sp.]